MYSSAKIVLLGAMICPLSVISNANPVLAGGSDGSILTAPATSTNSAIPPSNQIASDSIIPVTATSNNIVNPQQVNQQFSNWGSSSNLVPPSCNTGCAFAVTRVSPSSYGTSPNLELLVGVTVPFGSTDGGMAELNRINGEMQRFRTEHDTRLSLSRELSEALRNGDMAKAKLLAMDLAPMLGYKTYQSLLAELSNSQPKIEPPLLGMVQIASPSIMF